MTWVGITGADSLGTAGLETAGIGRIDIAGFVVNGREFVEFGWADCGMATVVDADAMVDSGGNSDTGSVDTGTVVRGVAVAANSDGMPSILLEEGSPSLLVLRVFMVLLFV